jgi:putative ABC transport system permease protein
MSISLPSRSYATAAAGNGFWNGILERAGALPGVTAAAMASELPPQRQIDANDTMIEGFVPVPNGPIQNVDFWNFVSSGYFEAVGARLIEGRLLNRGDGTNAPPVVVINQTMARTFWPRESAIGHRVNLQEGPQAMWRTIVGVVADIKNAGLDRPTGTELFIPTLQRSTVAANLATSFTRTAFLVIRTKGDPLSVAGAVRAQVRSLDNALPVSNVMSMEDLMSEGRARPRFLMLLLTLFSSVSLILAALGIYGVISYLVAQRTNEIGIRMALGAQAGDVLRLISATGLRLTLAGTVVGAVAAFALTRFLAGLLFGVSSVDPLTFLAMAAILGAVTLFACYIPARRASKVDPLVALRYE